MLSLISSSDNPSIRAAQFFITILIILLLGKLITLVPVMQQLQLADTFNAAEIIWFVAKLASLAIFFLFARYSIAAIPNNGGILSFLKGIADPLTALLIVIMGQALLWQMLSPFVNPMAKNIYYSLAIILIVCTSIWLVLRTYHYTHHIIDIFRNFSTNLSHFLPQQAISCNQCHTSNPENFNFCGQCGNKLHQFIQCIECGEKISDKQNNCQNCGAELNKTDTVEK